MPHLEVTSSVTNHVSLYGDINNARVSLDGSISARSLGLSGKIQSRNEITGNMGFIPFVVNSDRNTYMLYTVKKDVDDITGL